MTAEKPEGDVALRWPNSAEALLQARLESQASRIATLTEALELIAEASYLDGACLIARRALGQGEAK